MHYLVSLALFVLPCRKSGEGPPGYSPGVGKFDSSIFNGLDNLYPGASQRSCLQLLHGSASTAYLAACDMIADSAPAHHPEAGKAACMEGP